VTLLSKRLIFVTGKGGVGKTAVAAALGMVAARRGLRTIVAEVALRDDVHRALAGSSGGWSVTNAEYRERKGDSAFPVWATAWAGECSSSTPARVSS